MKMKIRLTKATPRRPTIPKRATLTPASRLLSDGRLLEYRGIDKTTDGKTTVQLYIFGTLDGMHVCASKDHTYEFGALLHVSMSYKDRDPSWDEIKIVRAAFFPDEVDVMMVLPRPELWVNIHQHCFHLWETPERWELM